MRRGRLHRLACLLFGCNFSPIEIWSAPPRRLVLFCSRCLSTTTIAPEEKLSDQLAKELEQRTVRMHALHLN